MTSILIAGVGGQGTLLASVILGRVALSQGLDVKLSEVHGMSQRGGSVITYVRIGAPGEQVRSPLIEPGEADVLLAFELMEAVRWMHYVNTRSGMIFANAQRILPMPVVTGDAVYPDDLEARLSAAFPDAVLVDALDLARRAGSIRAVNTVLLGAMAPRTGFPVEAWHRAVAESVKPKFIEVNERAFQLGLEAGRGTCEA